MTTRQIEECFTEEELAEVSRTIYHAFCIVDPAKISKKTIEELRKLMYPGRVVQLIRGERVRDIKIY